MSLSIEDHLDWIADAVTALSSAGRNHREVPVPGCPGWTVGHVVEDPGDGGQRRFDELMPRFVALARSVPPERPTTFWSGPATAARLVQWTATEIGVHLNDVARAIGVEDEANSAARAFSGLEVTTAFFSEIWVRRMPDRPVPPTALLVAADLGRELLAGPGNVPVAIATGRTVDLLCALFGRLTEVLTVDGDDGAFQAWCFTVSSPVE